MNSLHSSYVRFMDFAGGTVIHVNWSACFASLVLLIVLAVVIIMRRTGKR